MIFSLIYLVHNSNLSKEKSQEWDTQCSFVSVCACVSVWVYVCMCVCVCYVCLCVCVVFVFGYWNMTSDDICIS